jgi:hypothetical protein
MPNKWSRLQEATGNMGEALMRIAMLSDDRRYRAEQLARQGRLDVMAQQRIDMDEQMLAQSVQRTEELTRSGGTRDARAAAGILRDRGTAGYTLNLDEGGTMAEALTGLGQGVPQDWNFDATTSEAYLGREATNQQALTQAQALADQQTGILGDRATTLGEQGLDIAGRRLEAPEAATITMNGREFPDTPDGHAAALDWREQVEAVGDDASMYTPEVLELMRGGGPPDEGGNWLTKAFGGIFGGRGGGGAPADAGMMPQAGPTPEQMEQIQQLRDEGWTEEQIAEWLREQG